MQERKIHIYKCGYQVKVKICTCQENIILRETIFHDSLQEIKINTFKCGISEDSFSQKNVYLFPEMKYHAFKYGS